MSRFSAEERSAILRRSRKLLAERANPPPRDTSRIRIVHKVHDNSSSPQASQSPDVDSEPEPEASAASSELAWWEWTDQRIDHRLDVFREACGEVIGTLVQKETDARERDIESLRRELAVCHDEARVERKLVALNKEVENACQRQPAYEVELANLRRELEATRKLVSRQRATISTLEYQITQLDKQQSRTKASLSKTVVDVTIIGASTREALRQLQEDGFLDPPPAQGDVESRDRPAPADAAPPIISIN